MSMDWTGEGGIVMKEVIKLGWKILNKVCSEEERFCTKASMSLQLTRWKESEAGC